MTNAWWGSAEACLHESLVVRPEGITSAEDLLAWVQARGGVRWGEMPQDLQGWVLVMMRERLYGAGGFYFPDLHNMATRLVMEGAWI